MSILLLSWSHLAMYQASLYPKTNLPECLFTHLKVIKIGPSYTELRWVSKLSLAMNNPVRMWYFKLLSSPNLQEPLSEPLKPCFLEMPACCTYWPFYPKSISSNGQTAAPLEGGKEGGRPRSRPPVLHFVVGRPQTSFLLSSFSFPLFLPLPMHAAQCLWTFSRFEEQKSKRPLVLLFRIDKTSLGVSRIGVATPRDDCSYAKSNANTFVRARAYRVFLTSCVGINLHTRSENPIRTRLPQVLLHYYILSTPLICLI